MLSIVSGKKRHIKETGINLYRRGDDKVAEFTRTHFPRHGADCPVGRMGDTRLRRVPVLRPEGGAIPSWKASQHAQL